MKKILFGVVILTGCNSTHYYEPDLQQFDWVEPLIFEHNLKACRAQEYCRAETLFG